MRGHENDGAAIAAGYERGAEQSRVEAEHLTVAGAVMGAALERFYVEGHQISIGEDIADRVLTQEELAGAATTFEADRLAAEKVEAALAFVQSLAASRARMAEESQAIAREALLSEYDAAA